MQKWKFRNSGIFPTKIPEFRNSEKNGISGNPEIGISGIAVSIHVCVFPVGCVLTAGAGGIPANPGA